MVPASGAEIEVLAAEAVKAEAGLTVRDILA